MNNGPELMPGKKAVLGTMRMQGNSNSTRNIWKERQQFIYDLQSDKRCELSYERQVNSSCWWEREDKENWSVRRKQTCVGSPGSAHGKESACHCRRHKRCRFNHWVRKIPWRRAWQPTSVVLPGESPWTEESDQLQSIGSPRVGHD